MVTLPLLQGMVHLIIMMGVESTTIIMVDITTTHTTMVAEHIIEGIAPLFIAIIAGLITIIMGIFTGEDDFNTFLTLGNFFFSKFISIFATQKQ